MATAKERTAAILEAQRKHLIKTCILRRLIAYFYGLAPITQNNFNPTLFKYARDILEEHDREEAASMSWWEMAGLR